MPWMSAPIFTSMRARSCTCGSQAALPITVVPGVSAAAISAFSVAITDGSSMNTSVGRRPRWARSARSRRPHSADRAHRPERVEVRVQAPAADHVAARRRHAPRGGSARAAVRRAGTTRGSARPARGRSPTSCTAAAHSATSLGPRQLTSTPIASRMLEHRLHVADPRHVAHEHLILGQERCGEDRQRAVLVPGRHHRAGQRDAAFDDELLHELLAPPSRPPAGTGRLGAWQA